MTTNKWKQLALGIDAAWTSKQPSGVTLTGFDGELWHSLAISPSYQQFIDLASNKTVNWSLPPNSDLPDINKLLCAAHVLTGETNLDVIAVDMPLSTIPITNRRVSDNEISREFGSRGCAVHSPSVDRPGVIADTLRYDCETIGYKLATGVKSNHLSRSLIEVYPHTAILKLLTIDYRHPYKVSKSGKYWPGKSITERKILLLDSLQLILDALNNEISGIDLSLPEIQDIPSLNFLKRYEDAIDALVCSWVGIQYLKGQCDSYGDEKSAIWSPSSL